MGIVVSRTEQIRRSLEYYYNENHCLPKKIIMSLSHYNAICKEDIPEAIRATPYDTIFGIPLQIEESFPISVMFI